MAHATKTTRAPGTAATQHGPQTPQPVQKKDVIRWTLEERAELIVKGREIRAENPKMGVRLVLETAQNAVLPEARRRPHIRSAAPENIRWYADALEGDLTGTAEEHDLVELPTERKTELVELPPVRTGKTRSPAAEAAISLDPVPPARARPEPPQAPVVTVIPPDGKGHRRKPVFWTLDEMDALLVRARELRDTTGGDTMRSLIDRAQMDVLPPDRRRPGDSIGNTNGTAGQYLLRKMAEWPAARHDLPIPRPTDHEPARLALAAYAFPPPAPAVPPAPPEPPPVDMEALAAEAVDQMDVIDLAAVLARRFLWSARASSGVIGDLVRSFLSRRDGDHELLLRLAADLGVSDKPAAQPAPVDASGTGFATPAVLRNGPPPAPAAKPAGLPRFKALFVGGMADFGADIVKAVNGVVDLVHEPEPAAARARGFRGYDLVFTFPASGNATTKMAKNQVGHQNVWFINSTSAAKLAEEIRQIVGKLNHKRERKLAGVANGTN